MVWIEKSFTRVTDRHHEACRVMPNSDPDESDPRDRFFYPHHTHMKDTYNLSWVYGMDRKICHEGH